jgi:SAM-dependent methyltransferase
MMASQALDLAPHIRAFLADSYPHNHDYEVERGRRRGELRPRRKLRRRFAKLARLYPEPLASLLDVGCAKGFFVLEAAARESCTRALGIDVHAPFVEASRAAALHLGRERARFEALRLHELAETLDARGGPFQTVLVVNVYHYLFFGSALDERGYADHEALFDHLHGVTAGCLLFSNRVSLAACPRNVQARARELGLDGAYTEDAIRAAAEARFTLEERGKLGRIPLWCLTPR